MNNTLLIPQKVKDILNSMDFISIATAGRKVAPCAAYKFILKVEENSIYLIDYAKARTWNNIKANPRASLAVIDTEMLIDYQLNGRIEIVREGDEYEKLKKELIKKQVGFSTRRVIAGVRRGRGYKKTEIPMARHVFILKMNVEEVVELGPAAELIKDE